LASEFASQKFSPKEFLRTSSSGGQILDKLKQKRNSGGVGEQQLLKVPAEAAYNISLVQHR
jgi:hypothetical protein